MHYVHIGICIPLQHVLSHIYTAADHEVTLLGLLDQSVTFNCLKHSHRATSAVIWYSWKGAVVDQVVPSQMLSASCLQLPAVGPP